MDLDLSHLSPTGLAAKILAAIAELKAYTMNAVEQLSIDLRAIQASQTKTFAEIQAAKDTLVTLQATIADLETQLGNSGVPESLLVLAASVRTQAQAIDDLLPDVPELPPVAA